MKTCLYYLTFLLSASPVFAVPDVQQNAYAICLDHSDMAPNMPSENYTYDKGFEKCHRIVAAVSKLKKEENAPWEEQQRQKDLKTVNAAAFSLGIK